MLDKKSEIEKAFSMDERLSGRLDDSGEGTLGKSLAVALLLDGSSEYIPHL